MDTAKAIRAELKKVGGWTSRDISVRTQHYGIDGGVDITIKAPGISLAAVKAIAEKHARIDRCEMSGEILGGGNTYISVEMAPELTRDLAAQLRAALTEAEEGGSVRCEDSGSASLSGVQDLQGRHTKVELVLSAEHVAQVLEWLGGQS